MSTPVFSTLRDALDDLNRFYGVGDVGGIILRLDGSGVFQQWPYGLRSRSRRFTVRRGKHSTVYALGHQRRFLGEVSA